MTDDHSASRRADVLAEEAPHLITKPMHDPTRLRIDIDLNESTHALTVEVWAMTERRKDGSAWRRLARCEAPAPVTLADDDV